VGAFGGFDVWVNNAGSEAPYGPTVHQMPERFIEVTHTNILGAYYGSLVAMQKFLAQGGGKLINILGRGERGPLPMQNAYGASKAWLKNFTLALAKEYQTSGVGIFALSPGMMDTDMLLNVEVVAGFEHRLKIFDKVVQTLSQPAELPAQKAVWLASSATDGKTGLLVRELTPFKMLALSLRLLGGARRPLKINIRSVPAAFPSSDHTE
jgi:NAD(P)-dependent dehydrogenase (short-subunit alcohol dehydrogenase family)